MTIRPVSGGATVAKASTNQSGFRIFNLNTGDYAIALFKEGYSFAAVETLTVGSGGGTDSLFGTILSYESPPANMTTIVASIISAAYDTLSPSYVYWRPVKSDSSVFARNEKLTTGSGINQAVIKKAWTIESSDSSSFQFNVFANANLSDTASLYEFIAHWGEGEIMRAVLAVPDTTTFNPFAE